MTNIRATVLCHWGGEMLDGKDGLSYNMNCKNCLKLNQGLTYSQLLDRIYSTMQLEREENRVKMTCRFPTITREQQLSYMPLLIEDDDSVEAMLDVFFLNRGFFSVDLYVETEKIARVPSFFSNASDP
uniref:Uncharacterized protein n=1 Tax=Davidia involucrata TaxID=16924 RepID=A0A5B6YKS2_DAVIN